MPLSRVLLLPLFQFLIKYRRTALGPAWLVVGPALFIGLLGALYSEISGTPSAVFIPHLTIGLITWTLIQGFVTGSTTVFQRARAQIMQGGQTLDDIVMVDVVTTVLTFLHQAVIIFVVLVAYQLVPAWSWLFSLVGLGLVIANGVWVSQLFGILGARYRDLSEVFQAVMRIAFLATPIIWMPGANGDGGVMGHFLALNPFHHFLAIVRAPILGQPIAPLSWAVTLAITLLGFAAAHLVSARYARLVPLWV